MSPQISVLMITYNHGPWIRQAIQSVLQQNISVDTEIVIGEDASTDNTREEIEALRKMYPEKIFPVYHQQRLGITENLFHTFNRCRGKYIAFLEGDDWWTDMQKLQTQFDFLEKHPEVILCGGNTVTHVEGKKWINRMHTLKRAKAVADPVWYDVQEVAISNRFKTLTIMLRAEVYGKYKDEIEKSPIPDWPFFMSGALQQKRYFVNLPNIFGKYRVHGGGVFSGTDAAKRLRMSAGARDAIGAFTHYRYIGWHLPVLMTNAGENFSERDRYIALFEQSNFDHLKQIRTSGTPVELIARNPEVWPAILGAWWGNTFLHSGDYEVFTRKVSAMMKRIQRKRFPGAYKQKMLDAMGAAWRDGFFYSQNKSGIFFTFLFSPLRKHAQLHWFSVYRIVNRKHIPA